MKQLVILLTLLTLEATTAQELETKIFVLKARPAESTVDMVRPLLSSQGTVVAETRLNKLVVRDTPRVLREVQELLDEVDQHAPQVRIHVSMDGVAESRGGGAGISVSGNVRNPYVSGAAGVGSGSSTVSSQQNLLVMSGERGVLHTARQVLNPNPYFQFAVNQGLLAPGFVFQTVGTGFAVEPIVVGDVVRLTITPWMSFVGPTGRQEVLVNEASSSFAVKSGQSVTVSSGGYQEQVKSRAFGLAFGLSNATSSRSGTVVLRPVISDY